jgi:hypothetical protein
MSMDAARLVHAAENRAERQMLAPLRIALACACFAGLLLFGGVVAVRSWTTGFATPLGAAAMFAAGCFLAALASAASGWLEITASRQWGLAGRVAARWIPLAVAAASAVLLVYAAPSLGNTLAIAAPLVLVGLARTPAIQHRVARRIDASRVRFAWGRPIHSPTEPPREPPTDEHVATGRDDADILRGPQDEARDDDVRDMDLGIDELEAEVTQRWTRRMVDGWDMLEGWQRAAVERGARVVQLHVAVCPAFEGMPEASVELIDGEAASLRVAEATAFGLRVEARLDAPASEAGSLTVAIAARSAIAVR